MSPRSWFASSLVFVAVAGIGAWSALPVRAAVPTPAASQSPEEMEKWMAFATPGAEHRLLDGKVGSWKFTMKHWPTPDAEAMETSGTSESKWVLGDRYIEDSVSCTMMDMPFEGRGTSGYDKIKKKYFYTWIDNMGTGVMVGEGTYDEKTKTFEYVAEMPDPVKGVYVESRSTERMDSPDQWTLEMFGPGPDGKEFRQMVMVFTRQ